MPTTFLEGDEALIRRFNEYDAANPDVWEDFVRLAREMRATGRPRYSGWVIINKIRWDRDVASTGDVFKINNDFIALYVRKLLAEDPSFDGFFELRAMKPTGRRVSLEETRRAG